MPQDVLYTIYLAQQIITLIEFKTALFSRRVIPCAWGLSWRFSLTPPSYFLSLLCPSPAFLALAKPHPPPSPWTPP